MIWKPLCGGCDECIAVEVVIAVGGSNGVQKNRLLFSA